MDIPELVRQLLELRFQLKENYSLHIYITSDTIRARFWGNGCETVSREMKLKNWSTCSHDFLNKCWEVAKNNNMLHEQGLLPFN